MYITTTFFFYNVFKRPFSSGTLTLYRTIPIKLWEKEKMLFFFCTMFSTLPKANFNFSAKCILLSANAFNLDQSKYLLFGK